MYRLVAIPITEDGGGTAVFEVDHDSFEEDLQLASDGHRLTEHARVSLEKALADLKPTLDRLKKTVHDLAPDEAEIEFGLKIGGETGVIFAKGTGEVNFKIRVSWKKD